MYNLRINNKRFVSSESKITGRMILNIAELSPVENFELLYKINEKGFTPIQLDEEVDLKTAGIEGFRATPYKKITIKVDDKEYEVEECFMTPNEIMSLADINSDRNYLTGIRRGGVEVTYKDDVEHKISITRKSHFISCPLEGIQSVIVNAREKGWSNDTISFVDVVKLAYGEFSSNPNIIYTVNYKRGVMSKPEGSMVKGEVISVKNKMIFNVTQTNKS